MFTNVGGEATGVVDFYGWNDLWTDRPGLSLPYESVDCAWQNAYLIQFPWDKTGQSTFEVHLNATVLVFYRCLVNRRAQRYVNAAISGLSAAGFTTTSTTFKVQPFEQCPDGFPAMMKTVSAGETVSFTISENANWGAIVVPRPYVPGNHYVTSFKCIATSLKTQTDK